mmetsp:Transcript_4702/g.8999  ORF Transcript_4702/g.8999 Transcript_4702/m.8999 type:complete len:80 (+) Transcript_4702:128-367(+)
MYHLCMMIKNIVSVQCIDLFHYFILGLGIYHSFLSIIPSLQQSGYKTRGGRKCDNCFSYAYPFVEKVFQEIFCQVLLEE